MLKVMDNGSKSSGCESNGKHCAKIGEGDGEDNDRGITWPSKYGCQLVNAALSCRHVCKIKQCQMPRQGGAGAIVGLWAAAEGAALHRQ
jgi:hypothetical protein